MQALYAAGQGDEVPFTAQLKSLKQSVSDSFRLLMYQLFLITKTAEYSVEDSIVKSSKHLPTEEDKKFSVRVFHNPLVQKIVNDHGFKSSNAREHFDLLCEKDYFKTWFKSLEDTSAYKNFIPLETATTEDDLKMVLYLYRKVLLQNEIFTQHCEDTFRNWTDDHYVIEMQVAKLIEKISESVLAEKNGKAEKQIFFPSQMKEENEFAEELLNRTFYNNEYLTSLITPKLENWDKERVAQIDLLLMEMALAEMLYFENIPVKATINEYIEIAKSYSTPKSGEFINGILDRIKNELTSQGLLTKKGRGLIEN